MRRSSSTSTRAPGSVGRAARRSASCRLRGPIGFTGAARPAVSRSSPAAATASRRRCGVALHAQNGERSPPAERRAKRWGGATCASPLRRYRGDFIARATTTGDGDQRLRLRGLLKGVVPNEVPADWREAGAARQCRGARSYGWRPSAAVPSTTTRTRARSTRPGVEAAATTRRSRRPSKQVVEYRGEPATPTTSRPLAGAPRTRSSDSQRQPVPYLKSVKDPSTTPRPPHLERAALRRQMESDLSGLYQGSCSGSR